MVRRTSRAPRSTAAADPRSPARGVPLSMATSVQFCTAGNTRRWPGIWGTFRHDQPSWNRAAGPVPVREQCEQDRRLAHSNPMDRLGGHLPGLLTEALRSTVFKTMDRAGAIDGRRDENNRWRGPKIPAGGSGRQVGGDQEWTARNRRSVQASRRSLPSSPQAEPEPDAGLGWR